MKRIACLGVWIFFFLMHTIYADCFPDIHVFETSAEMGEKCAREIANVIKHHRGKKIVLGLATGSTPLPVYDAFRRIVLEENIDLSQVVTFNLDEYAGMTPEQPNSYHAFMYEHLFKDLVCTEENPSGLKLDNIYLPNAYAKEEKDLSKRELKALYRLFSSRIKGSRLTEEEERWVLRMRAKEYEECIARHGPIDIQIVGIGSNGHIGFAEPGTPFDAETSLIHLTQQTREDNSRFFGGNVSKVPELAITMGIGTIMKAKRIFLLASGRQKASIVHEFLNHEISPSIPATALRQHPAVEVFLDQEAAELKGPYVRYHNGLVLKEHTFEAGDLWVSEGKIIAPQKKADIEVDVQGLLIAPGYIDMQMNGGFGVDFSIDPENIQIVSARLPEYGVTAFFPTVITSSREHYHKILPVLRKEMQSACLGAAILGIHLEGPFFNHEKSGAHNPDLLKLCTDVPADEIYGNLEGVKIVTLAPELNGALDTTRWLKEKGIIVSAGHSGASYQMMQEAIAAGVSCATHLFNAMPSLHHREPGIVGSVLADRKIAYSLIGDPIHLHPKAVELAWRLHAEGLILVSDAIAALGLPSGAYHLGTMDVSVDQGKAVILGTETIAGSVVGLDSAVRYLKKCTGCTAAEAIESASLKPARLLGLKTKGSLSVGSDADFNLLDADLFVKACYVGGKRIFTNKM